MENQILNEIYFGKGPIVPMQVQFSKLRAKLKNKPVTPTTNLDPEILKFNRIVEKTFGFYNFALYIQPDHMPNAYTFGVETFYSNEEKEKLRRSIIANPTGFKFDTKHMQVSLIAAVNSGLLDMDRVTDEEIIAILLHEIHHGFYEAVCMVEPAPSKVRAIVDLLSSINNLIISRISNGKQTIASEIDKDINMILPRFINRVKNVFKNTFFKKRGTVSEAMSDNLTKKMIQYTNEKFADTGVAMYGYSEELHHCLIHMYDDYYEEMAKKQKKYPRIYEIYKMWDYYLTDGLLYLLGLQDEHPTNLTRISVSIQYIKRELAKEGIDPKMKRELLSQLEACQNMIDTYLSIPRDEDSMRIARMYYIKLWEKFGGDRREQDADNDALFNQIDNRYRELAGK